MQKTVLTLIAVLALSGCEVANEVATQTARDAAKGVVNGVVADRYPGLNATPITDCIIDNASLSEILTLASAAGTGVTEETVTTVVDIASRPETTTCIASAGLTLLQG